MENRELAMSWWNNISSLDKTQICDINTEIVGHARRHETLTGREIELLYNITKANKIYDLLQNMGGALESERSDFIYHHVISKDSCNEWRFRGKLGFGGKYRAKNNSVDCYKEDLNTERSELINTLNNELKKIYK